MGYTAPRLTGEQVEKIEAAATELNQLAANWLGQKLTAWLAAKQAVDARIAP